MYSATGQRLPESGVRTLSTGKARMKEQEQDQDQDSGRGLRLVRLKLKQELEGRQHAKFYTFCSDIAYLCYIPLCFHFLTALI